MPRYFVAVPLSDQVKDLLIDIQPGPMKGVRIIGRDELHVTLHFIGEVTSDQEAVLRESLGQVTARSFDLTVQGVGQFPPDGQPRVLWAGVVSNPDLTALHQSVGTALNAAIGFQPERRPYAPHVTLARVNEQTTSHVWNRFFEQNQSLNIPSIRVQKFVLYSSVIVNDIPQYRPEAEFELG